MEGKLCPDDYHKWLESRGDRVDDRCVKDLMKWLDLQTRLRRIVGRGAVSRSSPQGGNQLQRRPPGYSNPLENVPVNCRVCNEEHEIPDCPTYLNLRLNDRWQKMMELRVCFLCLGSGHRRQECNAPLCGACNGPHHLSLHRYPNGDPPPHLNSNPASNNNRGPKRCFLPVVRVKLATSSLTIPAKAVLDSCSELNIITSRCSEKLNLKGTPIPIAITGAGGSVTYSRTKLVEVEIIDDFGKRTPLECIVFNQACGKSLKIDDELLKRCKKLYNIDASKLVSEGGNIDILVGQTKPALQRQLSMKELPDDLAFVTTRFGPCIVGTSPKPCHGNYETAPVSVNSLSIIPESEMQSETSLRDILQCELAGISKQPEPATESPEDAEFDRKMKAGMLLDDDGRLKVDMPWKCDPNEVLKNNYEQAVQCDVKLMKDLRKGDPVVLKLFNEVKDNMIKDGIWRKVDPNYPKRFIPLIAVVEMERETSKVRVCLDSKRRFRGASVNEALLKGSFDAVDIFRAITKARCGKYVLIGDMKKMFWQIKMSEDDQRFHGIMCEGETYVFTRVCYGDKPSPSIADYSMRMIAQAGKTELPKAASMIEKKRYVDDLQDANSIPDELIKQREEVDELLGRFGFEIKEWRSNNSDIGTVKDNLKMLGTRWFPKEDQLAASMKQQVKSTFSKGAVLSSVNGIWDPIGILAGVRMIGKLIFQSIVRMKYDWEVEVSDEELKNRWKTWCKDISRCSDIKIDRSLLPNKIKEPVNCVLVGFSDGSSVAHGCTLYLRWADKDGYVEVKFVAAKGKVNPIKGTTVPRSEMCGAFLLSRLAYSAERAFEDTELKEKIGEKVFFTDSTTALSWTKSGAIKFKPFVKNKVIEMQELHSIRSWHFVPRAKNTTADLVSKGCSKGRLQEIIDGPDFLHSPREEWKFTPMKVDQEEEDSEKVHSVLAHGIDIQPSTKDLPIDIDRYSSWNKLLRVTACVLKFGKTKDEKSNVDELESTSNLSDMDIKRAEVYWIKIAQKKLDESKIENLVPFIDEAGIVRANGRLGKSELFTYEQKHPVILPKNHKVSELIVQQVHKKVFHSGYSRVVAEVRKNYWIVGVRCMARRIGRTCVVCRRWRGKAFEQIMSELPSFRVNQGQPFEISAVDYFGPFDMKTGYRRKKKAYGAVFTCLATRAAHIELVSDLTTQSFLLALTRFISRWDQPKEMRSDNGSNFVGAANVIREMLERWREDTEDRQQLKDFCSKNGFKWTFSTPLASHHNGCVESMIKSVKLVLNKIVHRNTLNEEEYRTVFEIVTNSVNSRPLYPANDDSLDCPITCNDLLRPTGALPNDPEFLNNVPADPRTRHQRVQVVANEWWKLWMSNFVPNLQPRNKWFKKRENVAVGDIVLLIDKDRQRSNWCMGVVIEVYPGTDGSVRSVKVRTSTGVYDRPITKLCLLLSKEEQSKS